MILEKLIAIRLAMKLPAALTFTALARMVYLMALQIIQTM
jgi:hypothetical protein